jgi:Lysylphosphatidylglycerol synthase TM region
VLALALVAFHGGASGRRVIAAVGASPGWCRDRGVRAHILRSENQARRFGLLAGRLASRVLRLVRRPPVAGWELATVKFRARSTGLVEHRWRSVTATSLVSHLSLYLVLPVALRDVGVGDAEVSWAQVLAVFDFARLATAIPLTPGGLGFVEGVLVTGLVGAGGDLEEVAAAVVVYRALTWALPILVGAAAACGGDDGHGRRHPRTRSARPMPGDHECRRARRCAARRGSGSPTHPDPGALSRTVGGERMTAGQSRFSGWGLPNARRIQGRGAEWGAVSSLVGWR